MPGRQTIKLAQNEAFSVSTLTALLADLAQGDATIEQRSSALAGRFGVILPVCKVSQVPRWRRPPAPTVAPSVVCKGQTVQCIETLCMHHDLLPHKLCSSLCAVQSSTLTLLQLRAGLPPQSMPAAKRGSCSRACLQSSEPQPALQAPRLCHRAGLVQRQCARLKYAARAFVATATS